MKFKITVKQLTPNEYLNRDDKESNPAGEYYTLAASEDEALDEFHSSVPIACLEDFDIVCEQLPNSQRFITEG